MTILPTHPNWRNRLPELSLRLAAAFAFILFALTGTTHAQVVSEAYSGGWQISAGGTGSGAYVQYGQRKMLGATAFFDLDTDRRIGIEGEGHFVEWRQTANLHYETYSIGARYHMDFHKFQPYAKGLIGFGDFNFPYNLATGRYLVVTAGGGADWHLTRRIDFRVADGEWQYWPQFTFGAMNGVSISTGVRVRIR
jgi:hypothetical protein